MQVNLLPTDPGPNPLRNRYLEFPPNTGFDTPIRQLRGFKKVQIAAGASTTVTFSITRKDLSVWDVVRQNWVIPQSGTGGYTINVGNSSRNLPLKCNTITGCSATPPNSVPPPPPTSAPSPTFGSTTVTAIGQSTTVSQIGRRG